MVAVEIKISFLGRQISLVCVNVSVSSAAYGSTDVSVIHLECFSVVFSCMLLIIIVICAMDDFLSLLWLRPIILSLFFTGYIVHLRRSIRCCDSININTHYLKFPSEFIFLMSQTEILPFMLSANSDKVSFGLGAPCSLVDVLK